MNKIDVIRGIYTDTEGVYDADMSKSISVTNLYDCISDVDKLVCLGVEQYLQDRRIEFDRTERIINDTMHLRNLFPLDEDAKEQLSKIEKATYIRRSHMKVEITLLETNIELLNGMVYALRKINKFNTKKNERTYTIKELKEYNYVMEDRNEG